MSPGAFIFDYHQKHCFFAPEICCWNLQSFSLKGKKKSGNRLDHSCGNRLEIRRSSWGFQQQELGRSPSGYLTYCSELENPNHQWRFIARKIIYKWAIYTMAMLNNQRVNGSKQSHFFVSFSFNHLHLLNSHLSSFFQLIGDLYMEVFQNGGTHKSSMLFSEFPKNKPSSYWPPRLTEVLHDLGDDLGDLLMINHRFQVGFRNHPQYFLAIYIWNHWKSSMVFPRFTGAQVGWFLQDDGPGWGRSLQDLRRLRGRLRALGGLRGGTSGAATGGVPGLKAINLGIFMGKSWDKNNNWLVVSNIFYFP